MTPQLLKRILSYLAPYWLQFIAVFVAILVSSVVGLLPSIITGRIVDQALVGDDLALLVRLLFTALGAMLTVGTITATVTLINRLYRPVESLLNLQVNFTRSLAMFTRIFDYLDRKSTIVNPKNGAKPDCEMATITYEHVAFGYDTADDLVLTDVNFTVPGGKMYAIVGPSGSGKSTVVNLIPRLYDVNAGSAKVAGVDVRDFDLPYLRECVGVVTQEAYLFNGTILDNLRYAKPDATQEEIERACRIANIHDFIVKEEKTVIKPCAPRTLSLHEDSL